MAPWVSTRCARVSPVPKPAIVARSTRCTPEDNCRIAELKDSSSSAAILQFLLFPELREDSFLIRDDALLVTFDPRLIAQDPLLITFCRRLFCHSSLLG